MTELADCLSVCHGGGDDVDEQSETEEKRRVPARQSNLQWYVSKFLIHFFPVVAISTHPNKC
jgi:hypothetical protein